jgi:hypothetical protein
LLDLLAYQPLYFLNDRRKHREQISPKLQSDRDQDYRSYHLRGKTKIASSDFVASPRWNPWYRDLIRPLLAVKDLSNTTLEIVDDAAEVLSGESSHCFSP